MKEKLIFEIFKERLEKHYLKTFYARMSEDAKSKNNVYKEMRNYCEKVKADYRKVLILSDNLRKEIYLKEKAKRLNMSEEYLKKENYRKGE